MTCHVLLQCKGFWPVSHNKTMEMIAKVTEKSLQTLPFSFTSAHTTLLALPDEVSLALCRALMSRNLS